MAYRLCGKAGGSHEKLDLRSRVRLVCILHLGSEQHWKYPGDRERF